MQKNSHILNGTGLVVLAGLISFSGSTLAQGRKLSDAQIEANVLRALAGAPELATQSIQTTTVYGTVTLSGNVTDEPSRILAETLASKAQGVQKVVDELTLPGEPNGVTGSNQPVAPQDQDQAQGQLQSDGTIAPADAGQQDQPIQNANKQGQQQAVDPRYGPAGPPPDMQDGQTSSSQNQGSNSQNQAGQNPAGQYPNSQNPNGQYPSGQNPGGQYPGGQNQSAPPAYRQPYRGAPQQYGQQPGAPTYGAQEGGQAVTVPAGALVRMRLVEGLTAKRIKAGTIFDGTVLNDVIADGEVAIPRGASVQGTIVVSNPSGAVGGKGQLALQLTSVSLSGQTYPIATDTWTHYGRDKTGQTVGNAVGLGAFGALIGAVAGGGAGAAIGAAAGGVAGIGASAASGRNDVVIPPEAIISFHLLQPAAVTTVSQQEMDRLGYGLQQAGLQRRQPPPPGYYRRPAYYPYAY